MRWPFGPPHLTLKPSKKQKTKNKKQKKPKNRKINKKKENKGRKTKKTQKYQKRAFQLSVKIFFLFWRVSKISLFDNLAKKARTQKNTIKIGVSATRFVENSSEWRNGHFWTKKHQIQKFQLSFFFCLFSSLTTTKNTQISWNPYFIVF